LGKRSAISLASPGTQTARSLFGFTPKSIFLHPAPATIGRSGSMSHGFRWMSNIASALPAHNK